MIEDFRFYIKIDPNKRINIYGTEIETRMVKKEIAWLYKDFGIDSLKDFTLKLATKYIDSTIDLKDETAYNHIVSFQNGICNMHIAVLNGYWYLYLLWYKHKDEERPRLELKQMREKDDRYTWSGFLNSNTWYYLILKRKNKNVILEIYSDEKRTHMLSKHKIILTKDSKFRYFVVSQTYQIGTYSWLLARSKDYELILK